MLSSVSELETKKQNLVQEKRKNRKVILLAVLDAEISPKQPKKQQLEALVKNLELQLKTDSVKVIMV